MKIAPLLKNDAITTEVISEKRILPSDVDWNRVVSLEDFKTYKCFDVAFYPEDFLLLLSDEAIAKLQAGEYLPLSASQQIGWYARIVHETNISILNEAGGAKLANISSANPSITIGSFDILRNHVILLKRNNILAGGFALCYASFRDEFDEFFMQFHTSSTRWRLPLNNYDNRKHGFFLFLLALFADTANGDNFSKLFGESPVFKILKKVYERALKYFITNKYEAGSFISEIAEEIKTIPDAESTYNALGELLHRYINGGIHYTPTENFTVMVKDFIDMAQTETENLRKFLEQKPTNRKSSVFLLGMLHTASRLEDQFELQNFELLLPSLFAEALMAVEKTSDDIVFHFTPISTPDGFDKLQIANRAYNALHISKKLLPKISGAEHCNDLLQTFEILKKTTENLHTSITTLQAEKTELQKKYTALLEEKNTLTKNIQHIEQKILSLKKQHEELLNTSTHTRKIPMEEKQPEPQEQKPVEAPQPETNGNPAKSEKTTSAVKQNKTANKKNHTAKNKPKKKPIKNEYNEKLNFPE